MVTGLEKYSDKMVAESSLRTVSYGTFIWQRDVLLEHQFCGSASIVVDYSLFDIHLHRKAHFNLSLCTRITAGEPLDTPPFLEIDFYCDGYILKHITIS